MTWHSLAIAKAEFLVWSSRAKDKRPLVFTSIIVIGIFWAFYLAPAIWQLVIGSNFWILTLLMVSLPGLMRVATLLLWMLVFVYPILYALQEIRIGQWEIILSCDVSTKSLLSGTFLGKIPSYGLMVLFLAPMFFSPFILAYEVSIIGQLIMYGAVTLLLLSTLWMSNSVALAVQAKIGESQRGEDLAKALSMIIGLIAGIPVLGLVYFAEPLAGILGLDVFLLFPFTWSADLISWGAILFSPTVTPEMITLFSSILGFDMLTDAILLLLFSLVIVALALKTADRVFTFRLGERTETVTTIARENIVYRSVRKIFPGPFGLLVITSIKDFFRKAENLSRIAYGVMMAVLMPVVMNMTSSTSPIDDPLLEALLPMIMVGFMLMVIGGITFGGTGFIESKDHLWVIRSAPYGSKEFVMSRLVSFLISAIPMALIPTIIVALITGLGPLFSFLMFLYVYAMLCCSIMVSIGVMAMNPNYESTRSRSFIMNGMISGAIIICTALVALIIGITQLSHLLVQTSDIIGFIILLTFLPQLLVGTIMTLVGTRSLARPEK